MLPTSQQSTRTGTGPPTASSQLPKPAKHPARSALKNTTTTAKATTAATASRLSRSSSALLRHPTSSTSETSKSSSRLPHPSPRRRAPPPSSPLRQMAHSACSASEKIKGTYLSQTRQRTVSSTESAVVVETGLGTNTKISTPTREVRTEPNRSGYPTPPTSDNKSGGLRTSKKGSSSSGRSPLDRDASSDRKTNDTVPSHEVRAVYDASLSSKESQMSAFLVLPHNTEPNFPPSITVADDKILQAANSYTEASDSGTPQLISSLRIKSKPESYEPSTKPTRDAYGITPLPLSSVSSNVGPSDTSAIEGTTKLKAHSHPTPSTRTNSEHKKENHDPFLAPMPPDRPRRARSPPSTSPAPAKPTGPQPTRALVLRKDKGKGRAAPVRAAFVAVALLPGVAQLLDELERFRIEWAEMCETLARDNGSASESEAPAEMDGVTSELPYTSSVDEVLSIGEKYMPGILPALPFPLPPTALKNGGSSPKSPSPMPGVRRITSPDDEKQLHGSGRVPTIVVTAPRLSQSHIGSQSAPPKSRSAEVKEMDGRKRQEGERAAGTGKAVLKSEAEKRAGDGRRHVLEQMPISATEAVRTAPEKIEKRFTMRKPPGRVVDEKKVQDTTVRPPPPTTKRDVQDRGVENPDSLHLHSYMPEFTPSPAIVLKQIPIPAHTPQRDARDRAENAVQPSLPHGFNAPTGLGLSLSMPTTSTLATVPTPSPPTTTTHVNPRRANTVVHDSSSMALPSSTPTRPSSSTRSAPAATLPDSMAVPLPSPRVLERSASMRGLKALFRRKDSRLFSVPEGDIRSVDDDAERRRRAESLKGMISAPRVVSMGGVEPSEHGSGLRTLGLDMGIAIGDRATTRARYTKGRGSLGVFASIELEEERAAQSDGEGMRRLRTISSARDLLRRLK